MEFARKTFRLRALILYVALCALLLSAMRTSRDSRPPYLYAGWLSDDNDARRLHAAQELGRIETDADVVVGALTRALLDDRMAEVRVQSARSVASVVSRLSDPSLGATAGEALGNALSDRDPRVRAAAAEALGRIAPPPEMVIGPLLRAAADENRGVRGAAVAALGLIEKRAGIDRPDVRAAITAAMTSGDFNLREKGFYAFWAISEKSRGFSVALLSSPQPDIRRSAVAALARWSPAAQLVATELAEAMTDGDAAVRLDAARAVLNCSAVPTSAAPFLTQALSDPNSAIREAARSALATGTTD